MTKRFSSFIRLTMSFNPQPHNPTPASPKPNQTSNLKPLYLSEAWLLGLLLRHLRVDVGCCCGSGGGVHGVLLLLLAQGRRLNVVGVLAQCIQINGGDAAQCGTADDSQRPQIEAQHGDEHQKCTAHLGVEEEAEVACDVLRNRLELQLEAADHDAEAEDIEAHDGLG